MLRKDAYAVAIVWLRRSGMFIATSRFNGPGSAGAKCDSLNNISLLRSLLNPNEALGYKYFVPTELRPFFASYFVITHNSNTPTEHYLRQVIVDISTQAIYRSARSRSF